MQVVDPTEENEQEVHETEPDKGYEDDFESGGEEEETDSEAEGIKQQQQAWLLEQGYQGFCFPYFLLLYSSFLSLR